MTRKNLIFVLSAPSGAGKTTLVQELKKDFFWLFYSISFTTRLPRLTEQPGKDYFFVSEEEFKLKIKQNFFLEWAKVHNAYYGTPAQPVIDALNSGKDVFLTIDVCGERKIKKIFPHNTVGIFVLPPSSEELKRRLASRQEDTFEEIKIRMQNAQKEIKYLKKYDYMIINDNLEEAVKVLKSIIVAEKNKVKRYLK